MALVRHRQSSGDVPPSLFDWSFPATWWSRFDDRFRDPEGRQVLRVEEFEEDSTLVVRAEMPGIDPENDVEISIGDGMLTIRAERTEAEETTKRQFHRKELRYGAFSRTLALPEGVKDSDIQATYKDGILEVRVPIPETPKAEPRRVPITRS